jgi:hypothetical protein
LLNTTKKLKQNGKNKNKRNKEVYLSKEDRLIIEAQLLVGLYDVERSLIKSEEYMYKKKDNHAPQER